MKDLTIAYLLWFFFGFMESNFDLERIGMGIAYFLTGGFFGIGWFIDLFTLPKQVQEANILIQSRGSYLSNPKLSFHHTNQRYMPLTDQEKEKLLLGCAKKYNGRITPVEVAADTDLSLEDAEEILKKICKKGYADLIISESGIIYYEFHGFLSEAEKSKAEKLL